MATDNELTGYVRRLNNTVLPFVDLGELGRSYDSDMKYAKGVLNRLHDAMVFCYGGEVLDESNGEDGMVMVPGVIRGRNNGKLCLALLDLDLTSSGEHWGTMLITQYGIVPQRNFGSGDAERREYLRSFIPYDYGYTATIPEDIHVDPDHLPRELTDVLGDFRNHHIDLGGKERASVRDKLRGGSDAPKDTKKRKAPRKKTGPEY